MKIFGGYEGEGEVKIFVWVERDSFERDLPEV